MNLLHLKVFVCVVRCGSFAEAARTLELDPSIVSRAIASLEHDLGFRLFHRTTRRLAQTDEGRVYFERVERVVDDLEDAHRSALEVNHQVTGNLRIIAPVSFAQLNVTPLIPEFSALYPDITFDLHLTDEPIDLLVDNVDLAIRIGPLLDTSYVATKLCAMPSSVVASPGYIARNGRPARPEDLVKHRCLLLDVAGFSGHWKFRDRTGAIRSVTVPAFCRSSNGIALKQLALEGMGIGVMAHWTAGHEIRTGMLVDLFPEYDVTASVFDNGAWLLYPDRSYMPRRLPLFADFLVARFRKGAPWATGAVGSNGLLAPGLPTRAAVQPARTGPAVANA